MGRCTTNFRYWLPTCSPLRGTTLRSKPVRPRMPSVPPEKPVTSLYSAGRFPAVPHQIGMVKLVLVLGALTAFNAMSIDMYLPAFPQIAQDLAVPLGTVQLSVSAFLFGSAIGQLLYGPLADRWGRKRPLVFGLAVYCIATIGCALVRTGEGLLFWRVAMALGGGASIVISRAVVRDLYDTAEAARMFSLLMLVMGAAPILAPPGGRSTAADHRLAGHFRRFRAVRYAVAPGNAGLAARITARGAAYPAPAAGYGRGLPLPAPQPPVLRPCARPGGGCRDQLFLHFRCSAAVHRTARGFSPTVRHSVRPQRLRADRCLAAEPPPAAPLSVRTAHGHRLRHQPDERPAPGPGHCKRPRRVPGPAGAAVHLPLHHRAALPQRDGPCPGALRLHGRKRLRAAGNDPVHAGGHGRGLRGDVPQRHRSADGADHGGLRRGRDGCRRCCPEAAAAVARMRRGSFPLTPPSAGLTVR
ncbi:membrane protein of unknown function [Trichlorobacter ammonificans]|uniref:Major facilitator superfamily (MFS) profile domain-containing protein n=1 Tax=Trichlorobacter ammonificans TaxID=2916410 RepID=A0ABM9D4V2_9BACT|nr:membrane protein of unknown function [Trichlorobacter ammonificans]